MDNKKNFIGSLFVGDLLNEVLFPYPFLNKDEEELITMKLDSFLMAFRNESPPENKKSIDIEFQVNSISNENMEHTKKMGFNGLLIPKMYNGFNFNYKMYMKIIEKIFVTNPLLAITLGIYQTPCIWVIMNYGSNDLKAKFLPKISTGEYICSYAMYEDNTTTNELIEERSITKTTAKISTDGKYYIINGDKSVINAEYSNLFIVIAKTEKGLSSFLVEKSMGIEIESNDKSDYIKTSKITLNNIKVPAANKLGENDKGIDIALGMLNVGKIIAASFCLGLSRLIVKSSIELINKQNDNFNIELLKEKIIQSVFSLYSMESMINITAGIVDKNLDFNMEASLLKIYTEKMLLQNFDLFKKLFPVKDKDMEEVANNSSEPKTEIDNNSEKARNNNSEQVIPNNKEKAKNNIEIPYKNIIELLTSNKIFIGENKNLIKYIVFTGLESKQKEYEKYQEDYNKVGKMISEGFSKLKKTSSENWSKIVESINIWRGTENQAKKSQNILSNFGIIKNNIDELNKTISKNSKKLFDITIQGAKNFKEETLSFLPNDLVGMTSINKVNELIEDVRDTFNLCFNKFRQENTKLLKKYKKTIYIKYNELEEITNRIIDLFILVSIITKTEHIITHKETSLAPEKNLVANYVKLANYISQEIHEKNNLSLPFFENDDINILINDIYNMISNKKYEVIYK